MIMMKKKKKNGFIVQYIGHEGSGAQSSHDNAKVARADGHARPLEVLETAEVSEMGRHLADGFIVCLNGEVPLIYLGQKEASLEVGQLFI